MVTNVYVKFNYDRLVLGNFRKSDNNRKNKNDVGSAWDHFQVQKVT